MRMTRSALPALVLGVFLAAGGWVAGLMSGPHVDTSFLPGMPAEPAAREDGIAAWFSPHGGCTEAIVREIAAARHSVHVQAYSFTSRPIAEALADAAARGLEVIVVLDAKEAEERRGEAELLHARHVPCFVDAAHAIAHNKVMLIDGETILTGSFNFTTAAEHSNAENLLVIHSRPALYAAYEKNFREHLGHSAPLESVAREHEKAGERR